MTKAQEPRDKIASKSHSQNQPSFPEIPECEEPPSMYWEGEDGDGYKEDGCAWLYND